jgi:2,4-dienoyl-CoA reductase-like NADH-dependent reductase (Old Yellow Enzyme family)
LRTTSKQKSARMEKPRNNDGDDVGIDRKHGAELLREGFGDLIAFGRDYIANPDLVERIRLDAPLNEHRPEGYYGSSSVGYTDYPFLKPQTAEMAGNTGTEQTHA